MWVYEIEDGGWWQEEQKTKAAHGSEKQRKESATSINLQTQQSKRLKSMV